MSAALEVTEKEFDAQLFGSKKGLATTLGWALAYHTLRSKGSQSGFPDRVLVRDRVIFVELKRETTKPTERQVEWLDGLAYAGAEVYLWRPSDLDEIGQILGRWKWCGDLAVRDLVRIRSDVRERWVPESLWVGGRRAGDPWRPVGDPGRADAR